MVQQFGTPQKTRQAVILFLKGSATPVLVEKEPIGPIKKLCFVSTQIAGLVLQEEPMA